MVNATAVTNESETTQQFRTWAAAAQIQWLQEARADLEQNPHDEVRALLVLETAKIIVTDETRRDISKQGQKAYYYRGSERIEAFRCPQPLHYPDVLHEGMKTLHQAIKNTPSLPQRDINILSKNVANTLTLIKNEREGTPAYASADNFIAGYALLEELSKRIQLEPREENPPKAAQKSRRFFSILSRQEPEKIVDDDLDYSLVARVN